MFIEQKPQKNCFAPAERDIRKHIALLTERWNAFCVFSYKHLAALRPRSTLLANFGERSPARSTTAKSSRKRRNLERNQSRC